jgi:hypothetical protein
MNEPNQSFVVRTAEQQEHDRFFSKVCNPDDWKAPIDSLCHESEREATAKAIIFFTATEPTFTPLQVGPRGWLRVTAKGYRMGPAGDH